MKRKIELKDAELKDQKAIWETQKSCLKSVHNVEIKAKEAEYNALKAVHTAEMFALQVVCNDMHTDLHGDLLWN